MEPLELSSYKLAKELGVSVPTVNEIVRRHRAVTAEMGCLRCYQDNKA